MKCPNCGTENNEDARFCKSCAAPQTPQTSPPPVTPVMPALPPPPPPRRPRQPHEDLFGLLSLAFFLLAVAVVFYLNPNLVEGFRQWTAGIAAKGTIFFRPPEAVIVSAAWFFGIVGVLEFVAAFLRWSFRWLPLRAVAPLLEGVGDLSFTVLLLGYASRAISSGFVITVFIGVLAALLMIYVTLGVYWSAGRGFSWTPEPQPPTRQ